MTLKRQPIYFEEQFSPIEKKVRGFYFSALTKSEQKELDNE